MFLYHKVVYLDKQIKSFWNDLTEDNAVQAMFVR